MTTISALPIRKKIKPQQARSPSDIEIIEKTLQGDIEAFEGIMRRYNARLFRIARSMLRDDPEAEDVIQETYLKAFKMLRDFRGPDGLGAWLSRILINETLMRARKKKPMNFSDIFNNEQEQTSRLVSSQPGPERLAASHQFRTFLEQSIDALPFQLRTVFVLRAVEQLSIEETAKHLNIKSATIKTQYHRAKLMIQQKLNRQVTDSLRNSFEFGGSRCDRIVDAVKEQLLKSEHMAEPRKEFDPFTRVKKKNGFVARVFTSLKLFF